MDILLRLIILQFLHKEISSFKETFHFAKRCHHMNYTLMDQHNCPDINFCKKTFNISYIDMPPYAPTRLIEDILEICCMNCTAHGVVNIFANISEISFNTIKSSHFVYPVLGSITDKLQHGYYFIPILHVPKAYYITVMSKVGLFRSIFNLYPLVTICLLMAIVAGFCCWIMETWTNTEEFSKRFPIGWFEGFWWSVVSMTTVGYGDKTPKTVVGRLFSVVWIFTGITLCGILTALLTTRIMEANTPKVPDMTGDSVGILKYRYYEALLVSHHGGLLVETEGVDFKTSIYELINQLRTKEIDGILFDRYTLWSIIGNFTRVEKKDHDDEMRFFLTDTVISSRGYGHETLAYGILVKLEEDYMFLENVINTNRFGLQTQMALAWNNLEKDFFHRHTRGLFSADQDYYRISVLVLTGAITGICIFGTIYELVRRSKRWNNQYSVTTTETVMSDLL